jgi:hypothetical protein
MAARPDGSTAATTVSLRWSRNCSSLRPSPSGTKYFSRSILLHFRQRLSVFAVLWRGRFWCEIDAVDVLGLKNRQRSIPRPNSLRVDEKLQRSHDLVEPILTSSVLFPA